MKKSLLITSFAFSALTTNAYAIDIELADPAWNGDLIPSGQQCQKFGGINPATPLLKVSGIPASADTLILEYSDRDSERMNNGGHGRMSYQIEMGASSVEVPSVAGHSFDIPPSFTMIEAHRGPGWDKAGAYMPPCSGGKGHQYYVTVKAAKGDSVLESSVIELGKF